MSLLDELRYGLGVAQSTLFALGPRPEGDPEGMRALARMLKEEAATASAAGRAAGALPGSLVFVGPAAKQFKGHAGEVSKSLFVANHRLDSVAARLLKRAGEIQRAQQEHDRARRQLEGRVQDLLGQIARAAR